LWPGFEGWKIENALSEDICNELGEGFEPDCFVPFVVLHEFEGLLFSDCALFSQGIGRARTWQMRFRRSATSSAHLRRSMTLHLQPLLNVWNN